MRTPRDNHAKCIKAAITAAILAALSTTTPAQPRCGALGVRTLSIHSRWVAPETNELANATSTPAQAQFDPLESPPLTTDFTMAIALGDVDGDGDLDIALGNSTAYYGAQQSRLFLNDGRGTYTDATATHLPAAAYQTTALALGDVDGDHDLDLVLGNGGLFGGAGQNRLYLNDGTGHYTDATSGRIPASSGDRTTGVVLGDVDGDGDLDLVVGRNNARDQLLLNDGAGSFIDATGHLPAINDGTCAVAMGDVDGDGDLDLVAGNYLQQSRLYLNNGNGVFADATAARLPPGAHGTRSLALGDVDGDGDLDLVTGNGYDLNGPFGSEVYGAPDVTRLFLNDGTGSFTDATNRMPATRHYTDAVALGDVDADGDLDVVVGNYEEPTKVYTNLLRQLDTPLPPTLGQTYAFDVYARYGFAGAGDVAYPFLAVATGRFPPCSASSASDHPSSWRSLRSRSIRWPASDRSRSRSRAIRSSPASRCSRKHCSCSRVRSD